MDWVLHESIGGKGSHPPVPLPLPFFPQLPPPPPPPPPPIVLSPNTIGNKISPSILLIIVILAVIFFISGLLHLLVRCLLRPINRDPDDFENATALQGQLQQLFHLHDSGVDQTCIDSLPVFLYKAIIGLKDPFDCAVCLCEFEAEDKLRLLPMCSHAFHLQCIDTWLLSHSTCPLCRGSLITDLSPNNGCSPVVLVLESGSESSREIGIDRRESGPSPHLGLVGEDDPEPSIHDNSQKSGEIGSKEDPGSDASEAKVVHVKLGKFRNVDVVGGGGEASSSKLDRRRCFSMGSYEYVMNENSLLQVAIKQSKKKPSDKKPMHRFAMSECDCHSRREGFKGFEASRISAFKGDNGDACISTNLQKRESFSVSKIWLRSKNKKPIADEGSRRACSFRFPFHGQASDESKMNSITSPRPASELGIAGSEKSGSEMDLDVEIGSCNNSIGSLAEETPSFARRTMLWIVGRQNKVGNHV